LQKDANAQVNLNHARQNMWLPLWMCVNHRQIKHKEFTTFYYTICVVKKMIFWLL